jgi:hypothetical protein
MAGLACEQALYRFAGETPAAPAAGADPARVRLLFVPGFLAACFAGIHSFEDAAVAARDAGFAADILVVGARDGIAVNARRIAAQIDALPQDGRRLVLLGHSKGAVDVLEMLVQRPDLRPRVAAVIGIAGAFRGSPLATSFALPYHALYGVWPPAGCATSEGEPLRDLTRERRAEWWQAHAQDIGVPVYGIVAVPEPDRLSAMLLLPRALLARTSPWNDGMMLAADQMPPGGALLGVVNADHVGAAIPYPQGLPWALWFAAAPFPRADVMLAAIDVAVAQPAARLRVPLEAAR